MVLCAGPMQEVALSRSSAKTRTSPKERSSSPPPAGASGNARAADVRHPWGRTDWLLSLVLAVVALGVYFNNLRGDWVYDDRLQILGNTLLTTPGRAGDLLGSDVWSFSAPVPGQPGGIYWRPLFSAKLLLLHRLFGFQSTLPWHLTNNLLHAGVCVLAFALLRRLRFARSLSFAGVLVFAVHPAHVESVSWISGSPDLLLGVSLLGAMLFGAALAERFRPLPLAGLVICSILALGSKEIGMFTPLFVALTVWTVRRGVDPPESPKRSLRRALDAAIAPALLSILYVFIRSGIVLDITLGEHLPSVASTLLSVPELAVFYLRQAFWPFAGFSGSGGVGPGHPLRPVNVAHLDAANFYLPLAVCTVVGLLWLALARIDRRFLFALGFFVLSLGPAMWVRVLPPDHTVRDRYLYLPLLGLIAMVLALPGIIRSIRASRDAYPRPAANRSETILACVLALVCVPLAVKTWKYNFVWTSEERLWDAALVSDPTSPHAMVEVAKRRVEAGKTDEALALYTRAIEVNPMVMALNARANLYWKLGRLREAEDDALKAVAATIGKPEDLSVLQNYMLLLGIQDQQGKFEGPNGVIAVAQDARKRFPERSMMLSDRIAQAMMKVGRLDEARQELEAALRRSEGRPSAERAIMFYRLSRVLTEQKPPNLELATTMLRRFVEESAPFVDRPSIKELRDRVVKWLAERDAAAKGGAALTPAPGSP